MRTMRNYNPKENALSCSLQTVTCDIYPVTLHECVLTIATSVSLFLFVVYFSTQQIIENKLENKAAVMSF